MVVGAAVAVVAAVGAAAAMAVVVGAAAAATVAAEAGMADSARSSPCNSNGKARLLASEATDSF